MTEISPVTCHSLLNINKYQTSDINQKLVEYELKFQRNAKTGRQNTGWPNPITYATGNHNQDG